MRNLPVVAAFMDIDKFKDFNTEHGETHVDLYVLPRFMAVLEAHVYARGYAYRFGGDEYAILLPNVDNAMGTQILTAFQDKLKEIDYRGVPRKATVSIGFCEVPPDCHYTNREMLQHAEYAKNFAKRNGRNCMATYSDSNYKQPVVVLPTADTVVF